MNSAMRAFALTLAAVFIVTFSAVLFVPVGGLPSFTLPEFAWPFSGDEDPSAEAATPAPVDPAQFAGFLDQPQTPGDWRYEGDGLSTVAQFGAGEETAFAVFCDLETRMIGLDRTLGQPGGAPRPITIATETAIRAVEASVQDKTPRLVAMLAPDDPLLDAMAITKGRFAVAAPGEPTLYLPAWAEVSRVIEDCR